MDAREMGVIRDSLHRAIERGLPAIAEASLDVAIAGLQAAAECGGVMPEAYNDKVVQAKLLAKDARGIVLRGQPPE